MEKPQYTKYSVFPITFSELKSSAQIHKKLFLEIAYTSAITGLERVADHIVNVGYSICNPVGDDKESD